MLTEITGAVQGKSLQGIFPKAPADQDFPSTFKIDKDTKQLVSATITGPFYDGATSSYDVTLDKYGETGRDHQAVSRGLARRPCGRWQPEGPAHARLDRGRVRGGGHVRRRAGVAGHDGRGRAVRGRTAAGGADHLRVPARLHRRTAVDRADRGRRRPDAGTGRRAAAVRGGLADHGRGVRPLAGGHRAVPAGSRRRWARARDAGAGRRPVAGRAARTAARRRRRGPGARRRCWDRCWVPSCSRSPTGGTSSGSTSSSRSCSRCCSAADVRPPLSAAVGVLACIALGLTLTAPDRLATGVTLGLPFVPFTGDVPAAHPDRRRHARAARCSGSALVLWRRAVESPRPS